MIIDLPTLQHPGKATFSFLLMSDLHIGSADCDKDRIVEDLEWARANKARALAAGDIFDLILPQDRKRFNPSRLDPALVGSDSPLNATLELGLKILRPYADLLYMIGCGNHETAMIKHHSTDIIAMLLERLNAKLKKHKIHHGGYTGVIRQVFRRSKKGGGAAGRAMHIWYHHGRGGSAPVTKGLIDFNRMSHVHGADVMWMGHKHNRYVHHSKNLVIPTRGDKVRYEDCMWAMSGSYDNDGHDQFDEVGAYRHDWAREKGFAPQGRGGIKVHVDLAGDEFKMRFEV